MLAHFALQKLHILPSVLEELPERERAFVYASIKQRVEDEKREADKLNG